MSRNGDRDRNGYSYHDTIVRGQEENIRRINERERIEVSIPSLFAFLRHYFYTPQEFWSFLNTKVAGYPNFGRVLRGLNELELAYIRDKPVDTLLVALITTGALQRTFRHYATNGWRDGKGDAVRHCYWASLLTLYLGKDEARVVLSNHEFGHVDANENHNNEVGIAIGEWARANAEFIRRQGELGWDATWDQCKKALVDRRLQFVLDPRPDPRGSTDPSRGNPQGGGYASYRFPAAIGTVTATATVTAIATATATAIDTAGTRGRVDSTPPGHNKTLIAS